MTPFFTYLRPPKTRSKTPLISHKIFSKKNFKITEKPRKKNKKNFGGRQGWTPPTPWGGGVPSFPDVPQNVGYIITTVTIWAKLE